MNSGNKNIIYTARDIEQYLAGKLSPLQMHAMEKAALDDPFLAEAMEGYEAAKGMEWNDQLIALHKQVDNMGAVAKVIPLHKSKNNWWKAAAAIFILGAGTVLTFILTNNKTKEKDNPHIAQTIPAVKDSPSATISEPPETITESLNPTASSAKEELTTTTGTVSSAKTTIKSEAKLIPAPVTAQVKPATQNNNFSDVATDDKTIAVSPPPPPQVINNSSNANNNAVPAQESVVSKNKSAQSNNDAELLGRNRTQGIVNIKKEQTLNNFFTAQVVSSDNSPLPFTNVSIKKDNFGTYADIKGMVRLVSSDSLLNIEVRSVGYLPKTFSLRSGQPQTKIVLQEDEEALREKTVVINKGNTANLRSRRATLLTDSAVNVEPADGWDNYNTYVANNLDIPESLLKKDLHGEVELTFDVRSNGTISNIRVNKSLGAEYDEAAKRLILEGPQWKVKKGKKTSASVKVQF